MPNLKRWLVRAAWLLAALVAAAALAWWGIKTFSPELSVQLSQQEIQAQLDPHFPSRRCPLTMVCFELRDPRVRLEEGSDRVGLTAQFVATLGKRSMPGTVSFNGKPHYVQGSGSFYLQDVKVTEFQMSGNAPDFDEVVRVRGPGLIQGVLNNVPFYTLRDDSKYGALAKFALRSVQVVDGGLRITFLNPMGWFGRTAASAAGG